MIRDATTADSAAIVGLALSNDMFTPDDEPITGSLAAFFAGEAAPGVRWLVDERGGVVLGVAYVEPRAATDRVWELTMLAVDPGAHGQGIGRALVADVEARLRAAGQRLLVIETSGTPGYARTRRFYASCGYTETARVPDYFADGDDMVLFVKDVR